MKAIIIGAGQGKRLLPLTQDVPKALLDVGGKSLVEWQVDHLIECGVSQIVFIAGFNLPAVQGALDELAAKRLGCTLSTVYNPFHAITDNLVSVWMARDEMNRDFLLLNSDTLFSVPVLATLLDSPEAPVTIAIDQKSHYDDDDMKVVVDGTRLVEIGKTLDLARVNGESIGMLRFRGPGPRLFADALDEAMLDESSLKRWYLSVIDQMARSGRVETASVRGHAWCEIDFPQDLNDAIEMVADWPATGPRALPLTGSA